MFTVTQQPAPARAAIPRLTVLIPPRPTVEKVLISLRNREANISLSSLLLSHEDMQGLIAAFSILPSKSISTLFVSQIFTNPSVEFHEDLVQFWNAIKHKVQKIIWDQNKFYKKFLNYLAEEIKKDPSVASCEFRLCDNTDSSVSANSVISPVFRASTPRGTGAFFPPGGSPRAASSVETTDQELSGPSNGL